MERGSYEWERREEGARGVGDREKGGWLSKYRSKREYGRYESALLI